MDSLNLKKITKLRKYAITAAKVCNTTVTGMYRFGLGMSLVLTFSFLYYSCKNNSSDANVEESIVLSMNGEIIPIGGEAFDYIGTPEKIPAIEAGSTASFRLAGPMAETSAIEWYVDEGTQSVAKGAYFRFRPEEPRQYTIRIKKANGDEGTIMMTVNPRSFTPPEPPPSPKLDPKTGKDFKPQADRDGDGVADHIDECPGVYGLTKFKGCPDADGDGITDHRDECPNEKGKRENKGCPPPPSPSEETVIPVPNFLKQGISGVSPKKCDNTNPVFGSTSVTLKPIKDIELTQISLYLNNNGKVTVSLSGAGVNMKPFSRNLSKDTESKISFEGKDIVLQGGATYTLTVSAENESVSFVDQNCHSQDGSTSELQIGYDSGAKVIFNVRYKF